MLRPEFFRLFSFKVKGRPVGLKRKFPGGVHGSEEPSGLGEEYFRRADSAYGREVSSSAAG
jgi:hypothetical protein